MKKVLATLAFVFAATFAVGFTTSSKVEATNCYYTCSCAGAPLRCCVTNGVTTCTWTNKIKCLAIITC